MHFILKVLATIIIAPAVLALHLAGYSLTKVSAPAPIVTAPSQSLGSYNPTGGGTYRLQTSIGTTNTSVSLSAFKEPVSNIPYTMSYLNTSIGYGTLDPQQPTRSEFISFTGITQNANGTAQLTGVIRGLSRSYPYTASTTLKQAHSGQSIFILSDSPQHFSEYYTLQNNATSSAILNFSSTSPPRLDAVDAQGTGTYIATTSEFATIAYVNKTGAGVNVSASDTVRGEVETATNAEAAAGTNIGGSGARLVLGANISSAVRVAGTASVVVSTTTAGGNGTISANYLDQQGTATYNWAASTTHSGYNFINSYVGGTSIGTSTRFSGPILFTQSSTTLDNPANQNFQTTEFRNINITSNATSTFAGLQFTRGGYATTSAPFTKPFGQFSADVSVNTASTTVFTRDIVANTISSSTAITGKIYWEVGSSSSMANGAVLSFCMYYGQTAVVANKVVCTSIENGAAGTIFDVNGVLDFSLSGRAATSGGVAQTDTEGLLSLAVSDADNSTKPSGMITTAATNNSNAAATKQGTGLNTGANQTLFIEGRITSGSFSAIHGWAQLQQQ